jgi:hypothetical protein
MTELSINIASENLDSNAPKLNTTFVQVCNFIGEADNPLLAPRGVFFDKKLFLFILLQDRSRQVSIG